MTGCNCNSSFYRKGKKVIGKIQVTGAMMELQDYSNISKEIYDDLEACLHFSQK